MIVVKEIKLLDRILEDWRDTVGKPFQAYKNHVYRVVNFCYLLHSCSDEDKEKITIAGAFHDLGIWVNDTVDYLDPSKELAINYLDKHGLEAWKEEIGLMITEHHKMTAYTDKAAKYPLVEVFRQADWIDVTFGKRHFELEKEEIRQIIESFPNLGFHKHLMSLAKDNLIKHPLKGLPMMKW